MSDTTWEALTDEQRKEHKSTMAGIYDHNAKVVGRKFAFMDLISVAQELRNERAVYFPHNRCFRGRIYPAINSGPHPQASDVGKGGIHFAEGKKLGSLGYFWLLVRLANCAGKDKMTLNERVSWALDHKDQVRDSAAHPEECLWWAEVNGGDEAWSLLATCHELNLAWSSGNPEDFISHLPVPMDGTCNGLQHLSALALDPIGAAATNLSARNTRQDIYIDVGQSVRERVLSDASQGISEALEWEPRMGDTGFLRSLVKRAVMTTPYGVTARGIRTQILNDDAIMGGISEGKGKAAEYIRGHIMGALEGTAGAAQGVMGYLRECASELAKAGVPFSWQTPSGSVIEQAYREPVQHRVPTLCGHLVVYDESDAQPLSVRKQAAGAPPNYVHSFDGAHLSMTVNKAFNQGIRSFAMIHDSYGTHAADTQTLARSLRESFVEIYQQDRLAQTASEIADYAPHVYLPEPPKRGAFDINEVLRSEFFFS
ncbi:MULTISPECIES: DNA-directed RNA polymerase [unclassified Asaia]|uniref:DNA-directed RNA polymerase n=1 Tax=unclassified Asaia TaxID=2685023 RepID=UPI0013157264|nr:DNA-directed RNA polymerase [Asaia sp. W19]